MTGGAREGGRGLFKGVYSVKAIVLFEIERKNGFAKGF